MPRLAIITSHPIQYYAPWFRRLHEETSLTIKVFYLWDFGATEKKDVQFGESFKWDIPLLEGYNHSFPRNVSRNPGTHRFFGLRNPGLSDEVEAFRPDAVLLMIYNYAATMRFLWSWRRRGIPLLFRGDSHRLIPATGAKALLKQRVLSAIFGRFSAFLYVGSANRQYYLQHGVPPRKLFFSPHAVDNERFLSSAETADREAQDWRSELGVPSNHRVILFAGKFVEKKRPLDLLKAFLSLRPEEATLLFVGSGEQERALRDLASGNPGVKFAPFQNQTQMPRTYAAADIFVLPSYGPSETWGLAINEAMCLAKPIIASTHVGCSQDLVRPGINGWVFEAGNVEQLKSRLSEALSNPDRLREYGKESRRLIQDYRYEQATDGLLEALRHCGVETDAGVEKPVPGKMTSV